MRVSRAMVPLCIILVFLAASFPLARVGAQSSATAVFRVSPLWTFGNRTGFTIRVTVDVPSSQNFNVFDVRLDYSGFKTILRAASISYSGNIFGSSGQLAAACIDIVEVLGSICASDDTSAGQVHFSMVTTGSGLVGPITDGLLFSINFSVVGNGTSVFTFDRAHLINGAAGGILLMSETLAGVYGNLGVVGFFNFEPSVPPSVLVGQNVTFDAHGSFNANNTSIPILGYRWDFGDGSPLDSTSGIVASHRFALPGNYQVRLNVTDARGSPGSIVRTVVVLPVLGNLLITVTGSNGQRFQGGVLVGLSNSSGSQPFQTLGVNFLGQVNFTSLVPGNYYASFSGSIVDNYSKPESVVAGWTTQDSVFLTVKPVPPPPPVPPDYSGLIFLGSLAAAISVLAVGLSLRKRRIGRAKKGRRVGRGRPSLSLGYLR